MSKEKWVKTRERYETDTQFRALVKVILSFVGGNFTPTEIQEAALLAHIIYNEMHVDSGDKGEKNVNNINGRI